MTRSEYLKRALNALTECRITDEAYDAMLMNADIFCDDDDEDCDMYSQIPDTYAEIEYDDLDSPEAIAGMRFDDLNFSRYMER